MRVVGPEEEVERAFLVPRGRVELHLEDRFSHRPAVRLGGHAAGAPVRVGGLEGGEEEPVVAAQLDRVAALAGPRVACPRAGEGVALDDVVVVGV
ncbi:hypothetical protein ACFPRL_14265 [Pseudoclavibacter helvolus]